MGCWRNSSGDMDFVCDLLARFAVEYGLAVDSPHHVHKGTLAPGDADSGRGSTGIRDASRLVYTLTYMSEDEANMFGVPLDNRYSFIRLDRAKVNITTRSTKPDWFCLIGVRLNNGTAMYPNGDEIQVVEPWMPPELWANVDSYTLNRVLDAIDKGLPDGNFYTVSTKQTDRDAWQVVQQFAPDKSEGQCRQIINTWVRNGVLVKFTYDHPQRRKEATGLRVNSSKRPS
jgi:hypothetical protein